VHDHQRVLNDVFGLVANAEVLRDEQRGLTNVPSHEQGKRGIVAARRSGDQFPIGASFIRLRAQRSRPLPSAPNYSFAFSRANAILPSPHVRVPYNVPDGLALTSSRYAVPLHEAPPSAWVQRRPLPLTATSLAAPTCFNASDASFSVK